MTITTSESPATASEVILGIDTHLDVHVAVALDGLGRRLGDLNAPTTVRDTRNSCTGRRASVPCAVPVWKVRAAMGLVSLVT